MKKLYKGLIVLFLLLALVLGLSACKEEPAQQGHVHTFSSEWTTNNTYHWHAATCEHTSEKGDKAKHTWVITITTEATHTTAGEKVTTCSVCGLSKTEVIPAKTQVHSYATEWTHDETHHWHATTCGHDAKGSYEPHTWDTSEVITPSSCTEEGTIRYTCKCGATKEEAIPMHAFSEEWTSDDNYHWHAATCEHTSLFSDKSEHSWGTVVKNTNGTATYTCRVCGKEVTKALPDSIRMVNAGPGEIASESAVISWHSSSKGSSLEYRLSDAEGWTVVGNAQCNEVTLTSDWRDTEGNALTAPIYRCRVELTGLTSGSTYKYRVKDSSGNYSDVATFKTAEADTTYFQFMWLSDLHTPSTNATCINRVRELIDFANAKDGVDIDFVLFSGDMVKKGQIYQHWNYWSDSGLMNDSTYAFIEGNHDYYGWNNSTRLSNTFYKDVAAYPYNNEEGGKSVLDTNYWFLWNRVLFVCVDTMTPEGSDTKTLAGSKVSDQIAWFKAVVDANEGNYDYLIFAQHYPWFRDDAKTNSDGSYSSWAPVFDQYKVDFALSSDEHHYRRSYPLEGSVKKDYVDGKVGQGTIYVVSNMTEGNSLSGLRNQADGKSNYVEYSVGGQGGCYFTVTPTEITLHQIGTQGNEYDTVTVMKKDRSK